MGKLEATRERLGQVWRDHRRACVLGGIGATVVLVVGIVIWRDARNEAIRKRVEQITCASYQQRTYTPGRLADACRVLGLDSGQGVANNARTREALWYVGLLGTPNDERPAYFSEDDVREAVIECLGKMGVPRSDLQQLDGGGTIKSSSLLLYIDGWAGRTSDAYRRR